MIKPSHFLVDSAEAVIEANIDQGTIWSSSPGLSLALEERGVSKNIVVRSPEALVGEEVYQDLWKTVVEHVAHLDRALQAQETAHIGFEHFWRTHAARVYFEILMWCTKALTLSRLRDAVGAENLSVVGCKDLTQTSGLSSNVGRHDHVFAAIASHPDCNCAVISTRRSDPSAFERQFAHVPLFDKIFNIVNRPLDSIAYQFWNKSPLTKIGMGGRNIVLLSSSDLIEESFIKLCRSGWRLQKWQLKTQPVASCDKSAFQSLCNLEESLKAIWDACTNSRVARDIAAAAWCQFWQRSRQVMSRHPTTLGFARSEAARIKSALVSSEIGATLSSGLYTPFLRMLDSCLRDIGVPVVCVDHGAGMGLGFRHDYVAHYWINFSDVYVAFNDATRDLYRKVLPNPAQKVETSGSPKIIGRSKVRKIQRMAGRRRLGVKRQSRCLIYVTNISINNVPRGYGTSSDYAYDEFQQNLLQCLSAFDGNVVVKPYPASRYPDPDPIWKRPLPKNVTVAPFGEFRHIRWAADMLLVDICSSTLAWAMATDLPLIYVDNVSNPMASDAATAAAASIFYHDSRSESWQSDLRSTLEMEATEISQKWHKMADSRLRFNETFVLGPSQDAGRALLDILDDAIGNSNIADIPHLPSRERISEK